MDGRSAFTGDDVESGAREKGAAAGGERDDGVSQNKLSAAREGEQVLLRPGQGVSAPEHGTERTKHRNLRIDDRGYFFSKK